MVRVAVRDHMCVHVSSTELPKYPPSGQRRSGVYEHPGDEICIDCVRSEAAQLGDIRREGSHGATITPRYLARLMLL